MLNEVTLFRKFQSKENIFRAAITGNREIILKTLDPVLSMEKEEDIEIIRALGRGLIKVMRERINLTLENQEFAAMDSARKHNFTFNEAISFMVECKTQEEIDYYWEKLTADGGQESMCGWLKDKFGVSWQVTPTVLGEMLQDQDKVKVERVTNAFLRIKKFDIRELKKAYEG